MTIEEGCPLGRLFFKIFTRSEKRKADSLNASQLGELGRSGTPTRLCDTAVLVMQQLSRLQGCGTGSLRRGANLRR